MVYKKKILLHSFVEYIQNIYYMMWWKIPYITTFHNLCDIYIYIKGWLCVFPCWGFSPTTPKPYQNSFHRNLYEGVLMNINRDIHFNRRKIIGWKFYHNFIRRTFQIRICWMFKLYKKMFNYYFIILSFYFISEIHYSL